jgi:ABC-type multidrug transport system ATPase subunit
MTLMAELYGVPVKEANERSARLLEGLGLSERKDSQVQTYSGGMRKRLILAMALLPDPEIVFLDEPTSALDVQSTRFIRMMLRNLRKDGKTLFLTTHNMDEAAELCDRIAIINRGKLVALDTPDHLSIVAGKVYLVDVTFDKPVPPETLLKLRGVRHVETAEAIEAADRMRAAAALAAARPMMPGARQAMPGGAGMQVMANDNKPGASENKVRIQTEDTALIVESLVEFTHSSSNRITNIVIRPPSLEDAFVVLTQKEPNNG